MHAASLCRPQDRRLSVVRRRRAVNRSRRCLAPEPPFTRRCPSPCASAPLCETSTGQEREGSRWTRASALRCLCQRPHARSPAASCSWPRCWAAAAEGRQSQVRAPGQWLAQRDSTDPRNRRSLAAGPPAVRAPWSTHGRDAGEAAQGARHTRGDEGERPLALVVWRVPKGVFIGDWDCDPASGQLAGLGLPPGLGGLVRRQFLWLLAADGTVRLIAGPLRLQYRYHRVPSDGRRHGARSLYESTKGGYAHRTRLLYETSSGQRGEVTLRGADLLPAGLLDVADGSTRTCLRRPPVLSWRCWLAGKTACLPSTAEPTAGGRPPACCPWATTRRSGGRAASAGRGITYRVVHWRTASRKGNDCALCAMGRPCRTWTRRGRSGRPALAVGCSIGAGAAGEHIDDDAVPLLLLDVRSGAFIKRTRMVIRASDWLWRWVDAGQQGADRL